MKDYLNRAERNDLLFLFAFMGACDVVDKGLKNGLTDEEKDGVRAAEKQMRDTLHAVMMRLKKHNRAIDKQLMREAECTKPHIHVPGSDYMEVLDDGIKIEKERARKLLELTSGQCIGCDGVEDCPLLQIRDALDEPPVNADSEVCQYRIDADELDWEALERAQDYDDDKYTV